MGQLALTRPLILQIKEKEKENQYSKIKEKKKKKKNNNDLAFVASHDTMLDKDVMMQ